MTMPSIGVRILFAVVPMFIWLLPASAASNSQPGEMPDKPRLADPLPQTSAIDRPDFKIRNLPYEPVGSERVGALDFGEESPSPGIEPPSPESVLAEIPDDLVIQYLDHTDFEKRMTSGQLAEKYIGAGAAAGESKVDARALTLRWLMMSDKDQRTAKVGWFKTMRSSISLEDFNRVVDVRKYRVMLAIRSATPAGLRRVDVPRLTVIDIEKLKMPELKPLAGWDRAPNVDVPGPKIRPMFVEPIPAPGVSLPTIDRGAPYRTEPESHPPPEEKAPTLFGIPGSLRNTP